MVNVTGRRRSNDANRSAAPAAAPAELAETTETTHDASPGSSTQSDTGSNLDSDFQDDEPASTDNPSGYPQTQQPGPNPAEHFSTNTMGQLTPGSSPIAHKAANAIITTTGPLLPRLDEIKDPVAAECRMSIRPIASLPAAVMKSYKLALQCRYDDWTPQEVAAEAEREELVLRARRWIRFNGFDDHPERFEMISLERISCVVRAFQHGWLNTREPKSAEKYHDFLVRFGLIEPREAGVGGTAGPCSAAVWWSEPRADRDQEMPGGELDGTLDSPATGWDPKKCCIELKNTGWPGFDEYGDFVRTLVRNMISPSAVHFDIEAEAVQRNRAVMQMARVFCPEVIWLEAFQAGRPSSLNDLIRRVEALRTSSRYTPENMFQLYATLSHGGLADNVFDPRHTHVELDGAAMEDTPNNLLSVLAPGFRPTTDTGAPLYLFDHSKNRKRRNSARARKRARPRARR